MMMNVPILVSVITLTYNKFDHLFSTIDSVINQDYPCIEYIISDDGSKEFPEEEIRSYIDSKSHHFSYKIIRNRVNLGTVKNINIAYKESGGELLFNLSAGDVFFNNQVVTRLVERFRETNCDVLVTSRLLYNGDHNAICLLPHYRDRKKIQSWNTPFKQHKAFVTSSFLNMASGSAMYFTRRIMDRYNYFDEKYVLWEDGPFIFKYTKNYCISTAYDIISIWYESDGVSSGKLHPLLLKDTLLFNEEEKIQNLNDFNYFDKKKVCYRNKSLVATSSVERFLLKLRYPIVFLFYLQQWIREKANIKEDKRLINEYILDRTYEK